MLVGLDLSLVAAGGGLKQGSDPHMGRLSESEKHLRLRVKQLICGSLNGMRIRQFLAAAIHAQDRDEGPLEGAAAGS